MRQIYLDCAAHTPADPRVLQALQEAERTGNSNSNHGAGLEAAEQMNRANGLLAELLGVLPEEIIHTSGASEANNLAIKGFARAARHIGKHIISTPLEHPSVSGPLTFLQEQGYEIDLLEVRRDGRVDPEQLRELLRRDTVLVVVCAVDSELGTVQPIAEIREILRSYPDCRLHVDATQAVGKIPFDMTLADSASFSAHKFFGLCGSGALYKRRGLVLEPLIHGGGSDAIYRSGTPTVSLNAATAEALRLSLENREQDLCRLKALNSCLREELERYPLVRINSPGEAIPHILNLSVKGVRGGDFQQALNERGVCVSVKSACSVPNTPSRAVFAVSRDRNNALSSWRISMSRKTQEQEITDFLRVFQSVYEELTNVQRA